MTVQSFVSSFSALYQQQITVDQVSFGMQISGSSASLEKIYTISLTLQLQHLVESKDREYTKEDFTADAVFFKLSDLFQTVLMKISAVEKMQVYFETIQSFQKDGRKIEKVIKKFESEKSLKRVIEQDPKLFFLISPELQKIVLKDKKVVKLIVAKFPDVLGQCEEDMRDDQKVVIEAITANGLALKYATERWQQDIAMGQLALLCIPESEEKKSSYCKTM